MVTKRLKHGISNNHSPDVIYFTNASRRLRGTVTAPQTSVSPSPGWASQIIQVFKKQTRIRVPNPCGTAHEENSVSRHAHLPSVDASQPPIDNHIRKREKGRNSMSIVPHCGRSGGDRLIMNNPEWDILRHYSNTCTLLQFLFLLPRWRF